MEKIDNFTIVLDKEDAKYLTGEAVTGHVDIKLSQQIKINFIKIQLSGEAQVMWTEESNDFTYTYSGRESLIRQEIVFVAKQGENELMIDPGEHKYPFTITLSPLLPTSLEHVFGTIRYLIRATIDMPSAFLKSSLKETKKPITIVNNLDLNELQNVRQPYGVSGTKIMCCGPCKSQPIMTYFSVSKTGYVPGEEILFNVYLDNKSSNEIKNLTVEFMIQIKFRATSEIKICRRSLKAVKYGQRIGARENIYWNNVALQVPTTASSTGIMMPPSTHRACIITVSYFLMLSFRAAVAISRTFTLAIPIKIGRIAVRNGGFGNGLEREYSMMPPTYEKCIEDDENKKSERERQQQEQQQQEGNNAQDVEATNTTDTTNEAVANVTHVRPTTARPPSYRLFVRPSPSYNQRMSSDE